MKNRINAAGFFLFAVLAIIIFLQVLSMVRSDRLYITLNKIEDIIEGTASLTGGGRTKTKPAESSSVTIPQYPGDEGDWLIWSLRVEPKTLNQINVDNDIYSRWITIHNIFEPLMVYDFDEVKLKPHLARSCEISNDGLEITFHLRDDIHFSDGVPITADDVIFTYQAVTDPNVDAANLANLYFDVNNAEKISDRVVRFYMKRPYFKRRRSARSGISEFIPNIFINTKTLRNSISEHPNPLAAARTFSSDGTAVRKSFFAGMKITGGQNRK